MPFEARDVIATWMRVDGSEVDIALHVDLPADIESRLAEAEEKEEAGRAAVSEAARLKREIVVQLRDRGFSQKETSIVLGVSPQRVHQLINS